MNDRDATFESRVLAALRALPDLANVTLEVQAPEVTGLAVASRSAGVRATHRSGCQVICEETNSQTQNAVLALLGVLAELRA
jgi:hypothetical protein